MSLTTTSLTRAAGLCAVAGGLLFIAVQVNHPPVDLAFVSTTEYLVRQSMKIAMAVLSRRASPACTCPRCAGTACSG